MAISSSNTGGAWDNAKKFVEADKLVAAARESINAEKGAAIAELKTQMAAFSIEIAEKVVRGELASADKQKALADKLVDDINLN